MELVKFSKIFAVASVFFLILDFIWLNYLAKSFYMTHMSHLISIKDNSIQFNWIGAVLVYIVLIGGIFVFVLPNSHSVLSAFLYGIAYGIITYGTYDFTCQAVMKDWPMIISLVDITWGMVVCSSTSVVAYLTQTWLS